MKNAKSVVYGLSVSKQRGSSSTPSGMPLSVGLVRRDLPSLALPLLLSHLTRIGGSKAPS